MATGSGIDGQFGIVDEVTYGTRVAPTRFYEFKEESLANDIDRMESAGIRPGRRTLHRWHSGALRAAGDVTHEFAAQGFGLLLKHCFGTVNTTGSNPYTHTFTPGALDGKSFTAQVGRPDRDGTVRPFDYLGCKVTGWELSAEVGEIVELKTSIFAAYEDSSQSLASASYPATLSPFVYTHGSLTLAGGAADIKAISFNAENGLEVNRHRVSATTPERSKEPKESELRTYSGQITADFESMTAYNRFVNGTEAALVLALNAGASAQFTLTCNVRFDGQTPNVGGRELLELTLPFKCVSGTSDAAAVTGVLINADSAP